jgi:hypothetical protein
MVPYQAIREAAIRGDVRSIRGQLASAKSAAFSVQRDVVDALCEIERLRRRLEQYQASALHLLSRPIISTQEARAMDASRP